LIILLVFEVRKTSLVSWPKNHIFFLKKIDI